MPLVSRQSGCKSPIIAHCCIPLVHLIFPYRAIARQVLAWSSRAWYRSFLACYLAFTFLSHTATMTQNTHPVHTTPSTQHHHPHHRRTQSSNASKVRPARPTLHRRGTTTYSIHKLGSGQPRPGPSAKDTGDDFDMASFLNFWYVNSTCTTCYLNMYMYNLADHLQCHV